LHFWILCTDLIEKQHAAGRFAEKVIAAGHHSEIRGQCPVLKFQFLARQAFGKTIDRQIQEMTRTNETQYFVLQKHSAPGGTGASVERKLAEPSSRKSPIPNAAFDRLQAKVRKFNMPVFLSANEWCDLLRSA
jgi:hypothetical protein